MVTMMGYCRRKVVSGFFAAPSTSNTGEQNYSKGPNPNNFLHVGLDGAGATGHGVGTRTWVDVGTGAVWTGAGLLHVG